jgi:hypothetical protein
MRSILLLLIFLGLCFADLNVQMRKDGIFVSVYECIKPSTPNVVGELCVASFKIDSNGKLSSSTIRNLRFPAVNYSFFFFRFFKHVVNFKQKVI